MEEYRDFLKNIDDFIFVEDQPEKADIIFVPGNGYPQMAERAAELYKKGLAPWILPSGKYSIMDGKFSGVLSKKTLYQGEYATEWEFLKEVLVRSQVPENVILCEDEATFTYENAMFSRKVTDRCGLKIRKAILCCKTYHARRCLLYYRLLYPETQFLVCPASPDQICRENWRDSEEGVAAVTGEITRIIRQFSLMMGDAPQEQE